MMAVVGEGVADDDVVDVLALDDHVGLADRIRGRIDLLPKHHQLGLRVRRSQVLVRDGGMPPGVRHRVVDGPDHATGGQGVVDLIWSTGPPVPDRRG